MTEDDLARTYEQATSNALVYGTGFVKVALINGSLEVSVVDPKDYHYIQPVDITGVWVDEMAEVPPEAWAKLSNKEKSNADGNS